MLKKDNFLENPDECILRGFSDAEEIFLKKSLVQFKKSKEIDLSGSCANLCFIINDTIYLANLGDSRAILFKKKMSEIYQLTHDHIPNDFNEKMRIINSGGQIFKYLNFN